MNNNEYRLYFPTRYKEDIPRLVQRTIEMKFPNIKNLVVTEKTIKFDDGDYVEALKQYGYLKFVCRVLKTNAE